MKKANNAQLSGAYAVIVAHNNPNVNIKNIIPYAEGHYNSLQIPIILINFRDGESILSFFRHNEQEVILSLSVEMEGSKTKVVQLEYWLNPGDADAYAFFTSFKSISENFGGKLEFEPKYKFQNLENKDYSFDFKKHHCVAHGRFCQVEHPEVEPLSVIEEAVRQICLWKETKGENRKHFWKYILYFSQCLNTFKYDHHGDLDCSERGFEVGNVGQGVVEKVKKCMGPPKQESEARNLMLVQNENSYEYSDIYLVPAVFLNGELLKEEISERSVIVAICDKLLEPPAYCEKFFMGGSHGQSQGIRESMKGLLIFTITATIVLLLIILFLVRRNLNKGIDREIYAEVNTYVSNYMRMKE